MVGIIDPHQERQVQIEDVKQFTHKMKEMNANPYAIVEVDLKDPLDIEAVKRILLECLLSLRNIILM
jgi:hypothetical protein